MYCMICKVRRQRRTNTSQPRCANERQQLFIELTTDKFLQTFLCFQISGNIIFDMKTKVK